MKSKHEMPIGSWCFSSKLLTTDKDWKHVHPDDRDATQECFPMGWQLMCGRFCGHKDGFDQIDFGRLVVRVRGAHVEQIPPLNYELRQRVYAKSKDATGVIVGLNWHLKRACVYYSLEFGCKRSGRWYFDEDLEPINNE